MSEAKKWEARGLTIWEPEQTALSIAVVTSHHRNAKANARLIAAAPELLSALEAILPYIPKSSASEGGANKYSENVKAADKVRAAIAAAKGEAS